MQNVLERMEAIGAERKMADFNVKMKMDYEFKKNYAYIRAWEFYNECCARGLNCHVSVGGLDSITLFLFLRSIGIYVPGISVSHLEDRSIQEVHKQLGIERVQPLKRADGTLANLNIWSACVIRRKSFRSSAFLCYRRRLHRRLNCCRIHQRKTKPCVMRLSPERRAHTAGIRKIHA